MLPHIPPKTRLCHFFDSLGNKRHKNGEYGCPRPASACHFIHPSEPEWDRVVSVSRRHEESSPRRPSSPLDRHYSASSSKRQRTPSFGSAYSRDRSPVWHSSRSPRRDDSPSRSHRLSPTQTTRDIRPLRHSSSSQDRASSSKHVDPNRQQEHVSKSHPEPMAQQTGSRDRPSEQAPKAVPSSSAKRSATSSRGTTSIAPRASSETTSISMPSASVKAPPRSFAEILPPPPPLNPAASSKDDTTPEHRRVVWEKRIALMADATQEYMELGKLEQDVQLRRRQVQSPAFNSLPSDVKASFRAGLLNAEATLDKKKASLSSAISRLSETNFWPSLPSQQAGDMEAKLKEAKTMLGGLADSVGQLYKRIGTLYEQRSGRPGANVDEDGTATGSGDGDSRAKKRRRLSVDDVGDDAIPPAPGLREDIDSIKDTIREIEDRLGEIENDMAQHSSNVIEQLEVVLEEKVEEIARSADVANLVDVRFGERSAQTIQAFNESFEQADRDIAELADEMANFIPRLNSLERDNALFKQEEAAGRERLDDLVKADHENTEAIARLQEEARVLQTALAKRTLPPSPALPFSGPLMEAIKGSIVKQVHEQVLPIVAETRTEIERVAKTRDMELYEKLKDKLDQSSKMSQVILTWIERHPEDARQAFSTATARMQAGSASGADSSG